MSAKTNTRINRKNQPEASRLMPEENSPIPISAKILIAISILITFLYSFRLWLTPIKSPDFWFHIKAGEWIVRHHFSIPKGDVFSSGYQGRDWIVNAWLSDVLLWVSFDKWGSVGTLCFQILLALTVFTLTAWISFRLSGRPTLAILTVFLGMVATYYRFNARPELFTSVLMVITLAILYQYKFRISDRVYWLIPLGALWANLHMGFSVAVVIIGCFLLGEGIAGFLCQMDRKPIPEDIISGPRLKKLALAGLGMGVTTLFNPFFIKAWFFMSRLQGQFGRIAEWQPLFGERGQAGAIEFIPMSCVELLAVIAFGTLLFSRRTRDITGWLLVTFFTFMALKFTRQSTQFCLVVPFVAAAASRDLRFPAFFETYARRFSRASRSTIGAGLLITFQLGIILTLFVGGMPRALAGVPFGFGVDKAKCSDEAIEFVRKNHLVGAKLYNSLELGGWLIWNLAPEQKVYIDGRLDMYGFDCLMKYLEVSCGADIGNRLNEMGVDYCYLRYPEGLESTEGRYYSATTLAKDPNWALVYADDAAIIYVHREPKYRELINRYEYKFLNPLNSLNLDPQALVGHEKEVLAEARRSEIESPESSRAHLVAGMALMLIGQPKEAVSRLETARKFAMRWGRGLMLVLTDNLGQAYLLNKDYPSAIRNYQEAILWSIRSKIPEREALERNSLGFAYLESKKFAEADAELKKALKVNETAPLDSEILSMININLGRVRLGQHRYQEGIKYLETALSNTPDSIAGRVYIAECYALMGDTDLAISQLEIAAQFDKQAVAGATAEKEFDRIRSNPRFQALARP